MSLLVAPTAAAAVEHVTIVILYGYTSRSEATKLPSDFRSSEEAIKDAARRNQRGLEFRMGATLAQELINGTDSISGVRLAGAGGLPSLGGAKIWLVFGDTPNYSAPVAVARWNPVAIVSDGPIADHVNIPVLARGSGSVGPAPASPRCFQTAPQWGRSRHPREFLGDVDVDHESYLRVEDWSLNLARRKPLVAKVNELFRARFGWDLSEASALAFTNAYVVADAVDRAGSTDPRAVLAALRDTRLPGDELIVPWEGIEFDERGDNKLATPVVLLVRKAVPGHSIVWPPRFATEHVEPSCRAVQREPRACLKTAVECNGEPREAAVNCLLAQDGDSRCALIFDYLQRSAKLRTGGWWVPRFPVSEVTGRTMSRYVWVRRSNLEPAKSQEWENLDEAMDRIEAYRLATIRAIQGLRGCESLAARVVMEDPRDWVRLHAVAFVSTQEALQTIASRGLDRAVQFRAFEQLDGSSIEALARGARSAARLAAAIKLGRVTWEAAAASKDARGNLRGFLEYLGALDLLDYPNSALAPTISLAHRHIYESHIKLEAAIPYLVGALRMFDSPEFATELYNSGVHDLWWPVKDLVNRGLYQAR